MTFHTQVVGANGQRQAMFIERMEGLAETILANFELGPPDVMIVFSAGGLTAVPIEIAIGARARGLPVIAVTSVAQSLAAEPTHSDGHAAARPRRRRARPLHAAGRRAGRSSTGSTTPVGPGSTIAAVALVNELKVHDGGAAASSAGALPPVLTSARRRRPGASRAGSSTRPTPSTRAARPRRVLRRACRLNAEFARDAGRDRRRLGPESPEGRVSHEV